MRKSSAMSEINLQSTLALSSPQPHSKHVMQTHKGCKFPISVPDAIAPVMNGKTSEPTDPKLEIQPILPEMSSGGRIDPAWFMTIGNIGPRKNPTKATQIAEERRCGTSQTTSSSLQEDEDSKVLDGIKMGTRRTPVLG